MEGKLPSLQDLRQRLEEGLEAMFFATGAGRLSVSEARRAAESVVAGLGVPPDLAARFGDEPMGYLLHFDADRIQSWVFASERIPVFRGASAVLAGINDAIKELETLRRDLPEIRGLVYSAGGGGLLFAGPVAAPENLEIRLKRWLTDRSHDLELTVVSLALRSRDLLPSSPPLPLKSGGAAALDRYSLTDGISGALARLSVKLRRAKEEKLVPLPRVVLPRRPGTAVERCPSCGRRPPRSGTGDGPERWCDWCRALRHIDLEARRQIADSGFQTFAELAEAGRGARSYLGFVAIDGNNMGSLVQRVRDFLEFAALSEATTAIYQTAREEARAVSRSYLRHNLSADPVVSLLSGGDEITLVLPAAAALPAACAALRAIERGFDQACAPGQLLAQAFHAHPELLADLRQAGAAAGVVLAPMKMPVRLTRHTAEALQKKQAKRICPTHSRSALAWQVASDDTAPSSEPELFTEEELTVEATETLLREVAMAQRVGVPTSAFWVLLRQNRLEAASLRSLAQPREALALLAANFLRYQMARNRSLRGFWEQVSGKSEVRQEEVDRWFLCGGVRRLERMVELLAVVAPPHLEKEEDAA